MIFKLHISASGNNDRGVYLRARSDTYKSAETKKENI